jgi:hypothetical protein
LIPSQFGAVGLAELGHRREPPPAVAPNFLRDEAVSPSAQRLEVADRAQLAAILRRLLAKGRWSSGVLVLLAADVSAAVIACAPRRLNNSAAARRMR